MNNTGSRGIGFLYKEMMQNNNFKIAIIIET